MSLKLAVQTCSDSMTSFLCGDYIKEWNNSKAVKKPFIFFRLFNIFFGILNSKNLKTSDWKPTLVRKHLQTIKFSLQGKCYFFFLIKKLQICCRRLMEN